MMPLVHSDQKEAQVYRIIDEAAQLNLHDLFITRGEPLILHDIFAILTYNLEHMPHVTILNNGILLKGHSLEALLLVRGIPALLYRHLVGNRALLEM